ncbi:MAG TPA: MarR family transcriptional regulator [Rhizomicrobium sp.]|jgi:DNA-binding MarR family transcriptional regulator|nr:MarR family transcriptional regulator [Rhizomicrobium sp.]
MTVDQENIRALAEFRSALRRFLAFSEEATRATGITSAQYHALLVIYAAPGGTITLSELARELLLRTNGAVQLADRLQAHGLIVRRRCENDRRSVRIALSPSGESTLKRLAAIHLDQLGKRKKQFAAILRQLKRTQPG